MELLEAIKIRHSVRSYTDRKIELEKANELCDLIEQCNKESGLNIRLCLNEPRAFSGFMATHYGSFKNVNNYIIIGGKKCINFDEKCGYYGEKVVLKATQLGLNTCWVALTYNKGACSVPKGEKVICVISLGYGETSGSAHKSKPMEQLCKLNGEMPGWFRSGMEAAMLAPTAMNQQKFLITLDKNNVSAKSLGGFYSKLDLGIVKYHFEVGAEGGSWSWK